MNTTLRSRQPVWLLLMWAGLTWSSASATTEGETALINSPLPHEKLAVDKEGVRVHWVRMQGYFEGTHGQAAMLDQLKADVQSCVQAAQLGARQTRPPQVWPSFVHSSLSDTYDTVNRTITYSTTLLYTVNHADCSLVENRKAVAKLASTIGFCEIDLSAKKAHGVCDARAHAGAPAVVHVGQQAPASYARAAGANAQVQAALAAAEKAMQQYGPVKTGNRKTIAGIECDVITHVLGTDGTSCISRGGSFPGWHAGPGADGSSMELELSSVAGLNARAVKAQLDATVNAAVFAPYLADGFEVSNFARRR
jgi:hypothetical protein